MKQLRTIDDSRKSIYSITRKVSPGSSSLVSELLKIFSVLIFRNISKDREQGMRCEGRKKERTLTGFVLKVGRKVIRKILVQLI